MCVCVEGHFGSDLKNTRNSIGYADKMIKFTHNNIRKNIKLSQVKVHIII